MKSNLDRMLRSRLSVTLTAAAVLVGIVAVTVSTATAGSGQKPPYKIGAPISLTGPLSVLGTAEKNGLVLAVRQINARGGVNGRKFALTILDDGSSPTNAISNVNRLISDNTVVALFGPMAGLTLAPASPILARRNIVNFAPVGQDVPGMTLGPTIFALSPLLSLHAGAAVCYASKTLKAKRVAVIATTDPAGQGISSAIAGAAKKRGVRVVAKENVELGTTDPTVQVAKLRDARPDVIINVATGTTGALIVKAARTLGLKTPIVGTINWGQPANIRAAGRLTNGAVVASFIAPLDPAPHQRLFVRTYQRNFALPPDPYAAWAYDSAFLIAAALKKVPNATVKDGLKLAKALETVKVRGVNALYAYQKWNGRGASRTGTQLKDFLFVVVKNGDFMRTKSQPKCT